MQNSDNTSNHCRLHFLRQWERGRQEVIAVGGGMEDGEGLGVGGEHRRVAIDGACAREWEGVESIAHRRDGNE